MACESLTEEDVLLARLDTAEATRPPAFTIAGTATWCRVNKVHDGDSMDVVMPLVGSMLSLDEAPLYTWRVRLYGVDAPHRTPKRIKGFSEKHRRHHAAAGRAVKAYLARLLTGRTMWIVVVGADVNGRHLVRLFFEPRGPCFNDVIVAEGLARKHGGTKSPGHWSAWELNKVQEVVVPMMEELKYATPKLRICSTLTGENKPSQMT